MKLDEPVHLQGKSANLTLRKIAREVVVLEITGTDGGEHGDIPSLWKRFTRWRFVVLAARTTVAP